MSKDKIRKHILSDPGTSAFINIGHQYLALIKKNTHTHLYFYLYLTPLSSLHAYISHVLFSI